MAVYVNLLITVVSIVRIMLFWLRSCENRVLSSFRNVVRESRVVLLIAVLVAVTWA